MSTQSFHRSAVVSAAGTIEMRELPTSSPGPGELLVALSAAGLCGTDLWKLGGGLVGEGAVLGHEVVGRVEAAGKGVVGFAPGDRVVAAHHAACLECALCRAGNEPMCAEFRENLLVPGGFSEKFLVRARAVEQATYGLPASLSDAAAVFLEPAACVVRGLRVAGLAPGAAPAARAVLVLGAGSMGLLHLLLLAALAPGTAVAVCDPDPGRRALALRLGAAAAAPPGQAILQAVGELSGGKGAEAVFDTVGGADPLADALAASRPGGTVVLFAHAAHGGRTDLDLNAFFKGEHRLVGTYSSGTADRRDAFRLLATGRLDPSLLVTHRLPLSRLGRAIELARKREALKVLLVPDAAAGREEAA